MKQTREQCSMEEKSEKELKCIQTKVSKKNTSGIFAKASINKRSECLSLNTSARYQSTQSQSRKNLQAQKIVYENNHSDESRDKKMTSSQISSRSKQRSLTLNQLIDLINDIYTQKKKFDIKCIEGRQPKQTMEQYLYTYLNQHYGLKGIIIEWTTVILNSIKKYSSEDNDVALFGKMLQNECEEQFRDVQLQIKESIDEIITDRLKRKYRLKTEAEITKMFKEKQKGYLDEATWLEVTQKMYNEENARLLEAKIKEGILSVSQVNKNKENKKLLRMPVKKTTIDFNISFKEFRKIILDFQLKSHEKYIKKFIEAFRMHDTDLNGILSEDEFKNLVTSMKLFNSNNETQNLLLIVDPFFTQQISFSDCMNLFSNQHINAFIGKDPLAGKQKITILEKFLSENSTNE